MDYEWLEAKVFQRCLDEAERRVLDHVIKRQRIAKGDKIVAHGARGGTLYILRYGNAEVVGSGNRRVRLSSGVEGSQFGEMTFLSGDEASADVYATSDCLVYKIARPAFAELMVNYQNLVFAIFAYMLAHTASAIRHMNVQHLAMHQYITGQRA